MQGSLLGEGNMVELGFTLLLSGGDNAMDARNNAFPLQSEHPDASGEGASSGGPAFGITDILLTLRRGWRFPAVGCFIGLTLAVVYIASVPTLYRSTARILIDPSMGRYLQTNKIIDAPSFDETQIGSQVYILSSESIVVPVIRSMNLAQDPEFVGRPKRGNTQILGKVSQIINIVKQYVGWNDESHVTIDRDTVLEQTAVGAFFRHLTVYREDVANVISITFESEDPNKAASIANAVADTYIATTSEAKLNSSKVAGRYIQNRLMELKLQAEDAERALQDFRKAHKDLPSSEQLGALNTQLTNARIAVAEAKARLDGIRQMDEGKMSATVSDAVITGSKTGSTKFALNSADIVRLRSEYRDLAAKAAELESSFGPKHAAVIKIHKQMEELRTSIRDQEQLISDSYANEYQMAKARETELANAVAPLVGKTGTSGEDQATMRQLESSADTFRNLYNSFIQYNTVQIENVPVQDARVITKAVPTLQKSYKKSAAIFLGSLMLGLFLGAGATVAREWAADVFRTPKVVEQVTGIHCVILPMVKASRERPAWFHGSTESMLIEEFVLDAPHSRFTETFRNVKASINAAQLVHGAKVIGVVSSVANEGKTTIAANLAALMIASSGARTLIIDSDVHRRLLTAKLAPDAREGLIEALVDPSRLDTLVSKRQRSGLDVLPCALSGRLPNAADLLGSRGMEQLLVAARKTYDYIIIEIAPIMSVVDVKMIERFIDRFIFVVEWGQTKRSLVLEALSEHETIRERTIGIVLNKVDPSALRSIEAYKGHRFRDYYQE
jgi:succinoglycan biosynthesis transport protein ExoP